MSDLQELGWSNPNRMLVLDDDEAMLALVRRMGEQIGYQIGCAASAARFFHLYRELRPTLVVLDLFLQHEDVLRVIDFLGKEHFAGGVILFSGFDHRHLRSIAQLGRDQGLNIMGTVEKGRNIEKVSAMLRTAFLGPLPAAASSRESVGPK